MQASTGMRMGLATTMSAPADRYSLTSSSSTLPVTPTTRFWNPPERMALVAATPLYTNTRTQGQVG